MCRLQEAFCVIEVTQLAFNMDVNEVLCLEARKLGREFVISASGIVRERESKNKNIPTGEIEIKLPTLLFLINLRHLLLP